MANRWTPAQQEALDTRNKNLLLSAAAGSGKTAVLTERITRIAGDMESDIDINELLVLTFTKAAAAEMKSRVSASLTNKLREADAENNLPLIHHLERQLSLMGSAQISTLDSFFQSLLRQYFYLLDLDPKTQIMADENEGYLLKEAVLAEVLERWYEEADPDFLKTADLFASRYQDRDLKDTILRIHNFSCSMPFPIDWLKHLPDPYNIPDGTKLDDIPWSYDFLASIISTSEKISEYYRRAFEIMDQNDAARAVYSDQLSNEYSFISSLAEVSSWKDLYDLPSFTFARLTIATAKVLKPYKMLVKEFNATPDAETIKALRKQAAATYNKSIAPLIGISEDQWIGETRNMAPIVKVLSDITIDFTHSLSERKRQEGVMDFNDLEHYVLDVLVDKDDPAFTPETAADFPSEAALAIRSRYKEVMIDEYQDTNGVQELITSLLSSGDNRFMVGDIKQSIYRFRQADPTIFLGKYNDFSTNEAATDHRIDLNKNFRSDAAILSSINFIFRQIMTERNLELNYGAAEALYPGRHEEERPSDYCGGSVSIGLIDKDIEEAQNDNPKIKDMENIRLEGRLIAAKIRSLIDSKAKVMNGDGTFRPITYSDIVILLRSVAGKAPILLKVMGEYGIPAISDREDDYIQNPEVETLLALLKIIDNPLQDLALTAVLRSVFVGLDEEDLSRLRLAQKAAGAEHIWPVLGNADHILKPGGAGLVSSFLSLYKEWRLQAVKDGAAPLIRKIIADTDYLTYVSGLSGGEFRKAHVLAFYQLALSRDSGARSGLYSFLTELSRLTKDGRNFRAKTPSVSAADAVRIMTIHRSKGLEFPVVFLVDAAKEFNLRDTKATAICHKDRGIGIQYYDEETHARWPSLYWYSVRSASERESKAEEARLLYVAMTRARDKLFITATLKDTIRSLDFWMASLAGTETGEVRPLPSYITSGAASYLDWIMPAALRHRSSKDVWDRLMRIPSYADDAEGDHSLFDISITPETSLLRADETADAAETEKQLIEVEETPETNADRFLASLPSEVPEDLSRRLTWSYAFPGAANTPGKLTATAAVKLRETLEASESDEPPYASEVLAPDLPSLPETEEGEENEETEGMKETLPADYAEPPSFLSGGKPGFTGTSFGTLMHKAMEMIDFKTVPATREALRNEIMRLTESGIFTKDEEEVLLSERKYTNPVASLITFAESPLGTLMKEAETVRKEMPFSILLPADSFYPDCEKGEKIFLQGIMDCLLETKDGLTVIDYKTDRVMTEEELREHYKIQLQVYGETAEKLLGKPVVRLSLWAFRLGKAIDIPLHRN